MPQPEGQPSIGRTAVIVAWAAWAAFAATWAGVSTVVWWRTGDLGSFVGGGAVVALSLLIPAGSTFTVRDVDRPARSSPTFHRQPTGTDMPAYQRTHDAAANAFWTHVNDRCMQVYAQDAETTLPDRMEPGFRAGLKAAVEAAWSDAYAEGYGQGRHDARMDAMNPQDL